MKNCGTNHPLWTLASRHAIVVLLVLHAGLVACQSWRYSPTVDEPAHLAAGVSHWQLGRFDLYRVNPPIVRCVAAFPLLFIEVKTDWSEYRGGPYDRQEFRVGSSLAFINGPRFLWQLRVARLACLPFTLAGMYFCFRWATDLYGRECGLYAATLWCFCPNIAGNAALITPDVGATSLGVIAGYYYWKWLRSPSLMNAVLAGVALGATLLSKTTWVILFLLWPALGAARMITSHIFTETTFGGFSTARIWKPFGQFLAIMLIGLAVLNVGYGLERPLVPLRDFKFISRTLGGESAHFFPGNRFAQDWIGNLPLPLPAAYLEGLDVQRHDFEAKKWSYLRGKQKLGGWWYYYLYGLAIKVPCGTLIAIAIVLSIKLQRMVVSCICHGRRNRRDNDKTQPTNFASKQNCIDRWCDECILLAPAIFLLILVSLQTGFSRYVRYLLPALPFVFIWTSQILNWPGSLFCAGSGELRRAGTRFGLQALMQRAGLKSGCAALPVLLLAQSVASSTIAFPHHLSYFNEFVGGPAYGHNHLLDANLDWGQDLLELDTWSKTHPEARPLKLAYFGTIQPRTLGLNFPEVQLKSDLTEESTDGGVNVEDGWYAISQNELSGYKHFGERPDEYRWFRTIQPAGRAGYSILIFHLPEKPLTGK